MRRKLIIALASLLGFLAVVAPLALSLAWSWREARTQQEAVLTGYAQEAIARADGVVAEADQVLADLQGLAGSGCEPVRIAAMREALLASRHLRIIGYAEGNTVLCSTLAGVEPFEAPPGAIALPRGDQLFLWTDPRSAARYLIFARGSQWVAIEGAEFVDVLLGTPDRSLAVLATEGEFVAGELNRPRLDEMRAVLAGRKRARDDDWFYAAARSNRYPLAAVAGEPRERVLEVWRSEARTVIPAGLAVAALLAFGVYRLARRQFTLPAEIAAGLRNGEFFAEYQPLVELSSGRCIGAEALVRWRRWDGATMAPDLFVPVAEECGLIGPITDHMVRCVVRDLGQFLAGRRDVHIAVNLAAPDLLRERIAEVVGGAISGTGIEPAQIWLEATERGFVDSGPAREVIRRLRALGHTLCIDDFGTGYSNLSYLQTLEVDALKIDKMFVEAIGTGAATSTVIDHMISMAGSLGLAIVAEGVKTAEQAEYLRARGVQYGQGYLFSKALPAGEFIRFVRGGDGSAPAAAA